MKASAYKKSIIILIVFFLLLLLGAIGIYFKDVIRNGIKYGRWFSVDKYEELLDYCDYEVNDQGLKIKCKALLKEISVPKNNNEICYEYLVYHKVYSENTKKFLLCEDPQKIFYQNANKSIKSSLNLDLVLSFTKNKTKYIFIGAEMLNFEESKRYFISNITRESKRLDLPFVLMGFNNIRVSKLNDKDNSKVITINSDELGKSFEAITNGIAYVKKDKIQSEYLTYSQLSTVIKEGARYNMGFFYATKDFNSETNKNFVDSCDTSSADEEHSVLCDNIAHFKDLGVLENDGVSEILSKSKDGCSGSCLILIYVEEL